MNEWLEKAGKKLEEEEKKVTGQKEKAMAGAVAKALLDFCRQEAEFAQAVVQGGSFADCMKAVAKGVGGSISDLEAYRKAVGFYFPGGEVQFQMSLRLEPEAARQEERPARMIFDLEDFL